MIKQIHKVAILLLLLINGASYGACLPSTLITCDDTPTISQPLIDAVLIEKSERKMYLLAQGERIKEYRVVFGGDPLGHKEREGDERTPEGSYMLDYKKSDSSFYKAIHISYPNEQDIAAAKEQGVDPGGFIMIHGQKNGLGWLSPITQLFNWTNGCIAVTNSEMDEIWNLIEVGTPIEINP